MATSSDLPDRSCPCDCPAYNAAIPGAWTVSISGAVNWDQSCSECDLLNEDGIVFARICPTLTSMGGCIFGRDMQPLVCGEYVYRRLFTAGQGDLTDVTLVIAPQTSPYGFYTWAKVISGYDGGPITLGSGDLQGYYNLNEWCDLRNATIVLTPPT